MPQEGIFWLKKHLDLPEATGFTLVRETKDEFGYLLPLPDTILISAGYSPNYITRNVIVKSFVRNDLNGKWGESEIVQGHSLREKTIP